MKKVVYFLLFLILALSIPASVAAQEPVEAVTTPKFRPAPPPAMSTPAAVAAPSVASPSDTPATVVSPSGAASSATTASQEGEAGTAFQHDLMQAINGRKAAGLPVPSVTFEYEVTPDQTELRTAGSTNPTNPIKMVGKTIIHFDGPEQAGYDEWPALVVKDNLPPEAHGTVKEGDYTEAYREFMEEKFPGYWEKHEFGQEPRTYNIKETIEITYPEDDLLVSSSISAAEAGTTEQLLMGFTWSGPHIRHIFEVDALFFYYKAGFELDWGLGLRLPAQANLTGPDLLVQGSPYDLSSAVTPLDWNEGDYNGYSVAPEAGNEFVLRLNFFVGANVELFGESVCSSCFVELNKDFSESFTTPFGPDAFFPIPPVDIPIYNLDLWAFEFGAGLQIQPNLGSEKITANWQASGDASGGGPITYSVPDAPVSFGPVNACNLGPDNLAHIQLDEFRYWFNVFLIELSAKLDFELFGFVDWSKNLHIYTFDLSPLTDGLYLGRHTQCDWKFSCSARGPDNTLNLSIPVVDQTPPTTTLTPSGTPGDNGWYISDVDISLSATDGPSGCGVGVKNTEYSFDGGATWNLYSGPFTLSNESETTVYYRSTDNENNVEGTKTQIIKIDKTLPIITGAPTTSPNAFGWYKTDVVVHFDASDAVSGIDTVTPDQTLSGEGANQSVTGTAVDIAGLSASFMVTGINIDKTKPLVSISSPETKIYENTDSFNVVWTATDNLSGVASQAGELDGAGVANGELIHLLALGPGPHTVKVEAVDKADNVGNASVTFDVTVDSEGLLAAVDFMHHQGWINKDGIATSLEAKLKAAIKSLEKGNLNPAENQLNAFLNELEAQKGKSINQQAYDVLKAAAMFVIDHLSDEV